MPRLRNAPTPVSQPGTLAAQGAVVKRLVPGAPGTKCLQGRFGDSLICVRSRLDATEGRRYTTVELLVEAKPAKRRLALVRIAYLETELRQRVKNAGGVWDPTLQLWRLPKSQVGKLGLKDRIVENAEIWKSRYIH